ncbi:MAG: CotH kinase family protein [Lachnospiraceae bacterium]|nr:CotH kinase family protein [Lachnospiraceae bacterium]
MKKRLLLPALIAMGLLLSGCMEKNKENAANVTPTPTPVEVPDDNGTNEQGNGDDFWDYLRQQGVITPTPEPATQTQGDATVKHAKATATPTPRSESAYAVLNVSPDRKFTTYVFSITGNPAELTDYPNGIFYGKNYEQRGRESERQVLVEAWDKEGNLILSQPAGLRIYGGYSRMNYLKSVKLYARESYDAANKNFKYNFFDTEKLYEDGPVKKYKRLVLRDSGNDWQFAWIRDELAQTLAGQAGFTDYEAVEPAVYYLNGEYMGFYWLHEVYCDNYFKNKYGDKNKNGEFFVIEGNEQEKSEEDDDEEKVKLSQDFNKAYAELSTLDYTKDANYKKLSEFMDVENYIRYYAYNVYICNKDWPNNNYKCYRYTAPEGEAYENGTIYDGRWRFLLHDMDYSMGLYSQKECMASYDKLGEILSPELKNDKGKMEKNDKYSPLFAALMKREECRDLFVDFSLELADGVFSRTNLSDVLDRMNKERETEMEYFFRYIEILKAKGAEGIWTGSYLFDGYTNEIKNFAKQRKNYSRAYMEKNFKIDLH